jgi:hypothetical protein
MAGFMTFIFFILGLLGLVFVWSAAGFIYSVVKLSKESSDDDPDCKVCEYLCAYSSSLTFQEQILLFPKHARLLIAAANKIL